MKILIRSVLMIALVGIGAGAASAVAPARHPNYIHALSDLRYARALLDQLFMNEQRDDMEVRAIRKIDDAIDELKRASIDDGKNLNDHPPVDTNLKRGDRYRKVLELLDSAHRDASMEEDNPEAQGLQGRIIAHLDEAHRIVSRLQEKYR